ncbi:hypothetical protein OHB12_24400 [Nocardia sp. NBC_01730]|uniref:hypothetical protein n=1 Tax=Nocardia sp. NBC_01730 TaxID=2975998 RepID=UPI002E14DFB3|nr:hypothetical protein OHB12_24400 [Nocardia sp. NBC_01730]
MFTKFIVSVAVAGAALIGFAGNVAAGQPSYADCLNGKGVADKCVQISDGSWIVLRGYWQFTDCLSDAGALERCYQDPNGFWYKTPQ